MSGDMLFVFGLLLVTIISFQRFCEGGSAVADPGHDGDARGGADAVPSGALTPSVPGEWLFKRQLGLRREGYLR